MDINLGETLLIIIAAAAVTGIAELVSWYLVYRTDDYISLVSRIETAVTKYNKEKEQFVKYNNILINIGRPVRRIKRRRY